jgi:Spy/CpxP family protein refolding chaperone
MPDPITPAERYAILARVSNHIYKRLEHLRHTTSHAAMLQALTPEQEQFVSDSIADACAAIDAAVAPVPTEEEIAQG